MATKKVQTLISRLATNRGVQTRKDAIRDFTHWFLTEKPELDAYTIQLLLAGDSSKGYATGIIQFCGKQKNTDSASNAGNNGLAGYQYKESVKLALELWVSCIHESFGMHAKSFQEELKNIKIAVYIQARLDIHIQIDEMKEFAGILIDAILYSTEFSLHEILPNESAQKAFKEWLREKKGVEYDDKHGDAEHDGDDNEYEDAENNYNAESNAKKKKATKWEQVKEEDLLFGVDDKNGGNDEWFDTLDFVGKRMMMEKERQRQHDDGKEDDTQSQDADEDEEEDDEDNIYNEYYFDDPLGQKKRQYVRQCIDRFNKKKADFNALRMQNDVIDTYYHYSPNIIDENFNATNFLVEIHNETDFEQLQNGLDKIEKFVRDQSHKMKELVREHFDEFVFCKDTIDSIHLMLHNNDMLSNTHKISSELKQIETESVEIYGTILNRTKKAKVLYETLQLIKQPSFKFLFTLPQTIKYHIMMRNYDQIIRIYKRVKNIQTQIDQNELLKKILSELNQTVDKLRKNLLAKLKQSDTFGDEQERIISYLIELDCDENPAIYFLQQRHENIMQKLHEVYTKQYKTFSVLNDDALHQQRKFVKKLCQIFNHYIPSFWKLSKSIIESKFDKQKQKELQDRQQEKEFFGLIHPRDQQRKPAKAAANKISIDYQNEKTVKRLFHEITQRFVHYIEMALNLHEISKNKKNSHLYYTEFAKDTLRLLLSAYSEMKSIKIVANYVFNIDKLMAKCVQSFLNMLFANSLKYTSSSLSQEKWSPHRDIPGVTTTPLLFMEEISKNLQIVLDLGIKILYDADDQYLTHLQTHTTQHNDAHLDDDRYPEDADEDEADAYIPFQDDISNPPSEASKLSERNNGAQSLLSEVEYELNALWLVPLIASYFIESHKIFADCLHELVYPSASSASAADNSQSAVAKKAEHGNSNKINILSNYREKSSDKKLLYILGNTIYTKETILEKIWAKFIKKSGIVGIEYISTLETAKNDVISLYNSLEQMVFDKYVRCKTLLLNRVIDTSLLCDGINWETISEVKGIRNHCLQLLLHFVFIHNEVYNSSKQELDNVLISLLEKVADHLLSTIKQIDSFSPSGALQILIEIDFLKNTLSKYLQPDGSQIVFSQIQQLLYQWIDQDSSIIEKRKQQLTLHTKASTAVMFSCFSCVAR
mmetsp:Transcript_53896/g.86249  ORF Transcript_53896/g.86249 Transcript_53896/m.86249 type:complete len:1164 (+) Transcript_53896:497-3988(+)